METALSEGLVWVFALEPASRQLGLEGQRLLAA